MIDVGLREGVWALVAVLSIYLAVILFRLALPGRAGRAAEGEARSPQTVVADAPADPAPAQVAPPDPLAVPQETLNEIEIQQLRRDVAQLRTEQDFLRSELVALRLDMNELQAAHDRALAQPQPQYVRPESPQHSEAMLLAGRGIPAAQIAEHCGISVAEAELVCALARAEGGA
ncbi:DUF2802 domain-containing protein [Zoogloea sp.]|jgi:hypothetical protein|uniref:DUF2802 domain-containing protein n=1 Tax=Zoogloea sp. TaxID=49181 RepID=UPI0035B44C23